jgi:FdhD protein
MHAKMDPYRKRKIIRKHAAAFEEKEDYIAVEKKLKVSVNGKDFITLHCTPLMIKELIVGLFVTEGIIPDIHPENIKIGYGEEVLVDIPVLENLSTEGFITSRCIGGVTLGKKTIFDTVKDDFPLGAEALKRIFEDFQKKSELFRLTGCFHAAAISDGEKILVFAEDIGRHNAVDKVIGYCLLENIPFRRKLMLVSCRLSSEIVSKCSRWGIPILASRAASTDLAVEIAETTGMTLVGFVRGDSMNIYTHPQRIVM